MISFADQLQRYPVVRVSLFLMTGIAMGYVCTFCPPTVWMSALLAGLLLCWVLRRKTILQSLVLCLCVFFWGAWLMSRQCLLIGDGVAMPERTYEAVVASEPVIKKRVVQFDLLITDIPSLTPSSSPISSLPLVRASLWRDSLSSRLQPGNGLCVTSALRKPSDFPDATFSYKDYLLRHGYGSTTFIPSGHWYSKAVSMRHLTFLQRLRIHALRLRHQLVEQYQSLGFSEERLAVMAAMTVGDKSLLTKELRQRYSDAGGSHILALSGLHLGIIYMVLSLVFFVRRPPVHRMGRYLLSSILLLIAVWGYVFLAGLPLSMIRSAVMITIFVLVQLFHRQPLSLNSLALAAVVMLAYNPMNILDVGFQFSFCAVAAILLFYQPLFSLFGPLRSPLLRWLWGMVAVSLSAQLGTAPLVIYHFGQFPNYFLLTNFIVIPVATVVLFGTVLLFLLLFLSKLFSLFLPFVVTAVIEPLLRTVGEVLSSLLGGMNDALTFVTSLPAAYIHGLHIPLYSVFLLYASILCLYFLLKKV